MDQLGPLHAQGAIESVEVVAGSLTITISRFLGTPFSEVDHVIFVCLGDKAAVFLADVIAVFWLVLLGRRGGSRIRPFEVLPLQCLKAAALRTWDVIAALIGFLLIGLRDRAGPAHAWGGDAQD